MRHHASSSRALARATWLLLAAANGCSSNTSDTNSGVNTPPASGTAGLGGLPTTATAGSGTVTAGKGATAGAAPAANGGSGGTTTLGTAGTGATAGAGGKAGAAGASTAGVGGTTGAAAGSGGSSGSAATFTQVYALFMTNCSGSSCHIGSAFGAGGLNMATQAMAFTNLVGVASSSCSAEKRVVAGDPDKSELVHVLEQTQLGTCTRTPKMPEGKAKLAQTDIDRVVSWVMAGAANN